MTAPTAAPGPVVGAAAPDFTLRGQHGEDVTLSGYRGVCNTLLVFFPFAFSGVCTGELAAIRDNADLFASHDTEVLAISCDPMYALRVYSEHERLYCSLLSDFWPHGEVARSYHVFNDGIGSAERGSFLIDRDGVLRWSVRTELGQARDMQAYADAVAALDG